MPRAMLGEVELDVIQEEAPEQLNEITEKPVEQGANIVDHVRPQASTLHLSGIVVGELAPQKLAELRRYRQEGARLSYVGRNVFSDVVIQSLSTKHGADNRDGFGFDIALREVRAVSLVTTTITVPPAVKPQAAGVGNGGDKPPGDADTDSEQKRSFLATLWDTIINSLKKHDPNRTQWPFGEPATT